MNIFINADDYNHDAIKTKEELEGICGKLNVNVTEDIDDADFIVSVGGDGTFLKSSKLSPKTPILGVNCGTLGYLTEVNAENLEDALINILKNDYFIEKRMMIEGEIITKENVMIPAALNEIAISKNNFGVVRFDVFVNDKLINSYTADGILIATPTGSTAYNLSCGGPIVDPTANIITLTPIAPHTVLNRSIVLSDEAVVKVKITELRGNTAYVLSDGSPVEIKTGDSIIIKKSEDNVNIVKLDWSSFIDRVREIY